MRTCLDVIGNVQFCSIRMECSFFELKDLLERLEHVKTSRKAFQCFNYKVRHYFYFNKLLGGEMLELTAKLPVIF